MVSCLTKDGKGHLSFVGFGLGGMESVGMEAQEELQNAETVFLESYTSLFNVDSLVALESDLGRSVVLLERAEVEDGTMILDKAALGRVVFLTAGDSMSATTHVELRLCAMERGIPTRVFHSSSVLTAVPSELGLSHYKFGRTTTLVFPRKEYFPLSPYDYIGDNLSMGLHSLVLLDIVTEKDSQFIPPELSTSHRSFGGRSFVLMNSSAGMKLLQRMETERGLGLLGDETLVCSVARAGTKEVSVRAGPLGDMADVVMGGPLHSIVIPGNLHFMEARSLVELAGAPKTILDENK